MASSLLQPGLIDDVSDSESMVLAPLAESGHSINFDFEPDDEPLDHDLYGFAMVAMLQDMHAMAMAANGGKRCLRLCRSIIAVGTLFFSITLQVFLLFFVRAFSTAETVHDLRTFYDRFEQVMYGNDPTHKGVREFFRPELFETMTDVERHKACHMTLGQPVFLVLVLSIWALACLKETQRALKLLSLIWHLPSAASATSQLTVVQYSGMDGAEVNLPQLRNLGFSDTQLRGLCSVLEAYRGQAKEMMSEKVILISGLTTCSRAVITVFVLLPRMLLSFVLVWLGCYKLAATSTTAEVISNGVALSFIALLGRLLYHVCVPGASKRAVAQMRLYLPQKLQPGSCGALLGVALWGVLAISWALAYIFYLQTVLPGYRWDVSRVCVSFMLEFYRS